jgi:hypothetical protein
MRMEENGGGDQRICNLVNCSYLLYSGLALIDPVMSEIEAITLRIRYR